MDKSKHTRNLGRTRGFTLVELMITVAILFILAGIAIPLYSGYIREGHFTTIRSDMNGLRTSIEDYRLENATYVGATAEPGVSQFLADINGGSYTFSVSATSNSYDVQGVLSAKIWVRCENRMNKCCDADTPSASGPTAACPP